MDAVRSQDVCLADDLCLVEPFPSTLCLDHLSSSTICRSVVGKTQFRFLMCGMKKFNVIARRRFHCGTDDSSIVFLKYLRKSFAIILPILAMATNAPLAHAESVVGKISSVNGEVQIVRGGKTLVATNGMAIRLHDQVVTGTDGSVTIVMADQNVLHLGLSGTLLIGKSTTSSALVAPATPDLFSDR